MYPFFNFNYCFNNKCRAQKLDEFFNSWFFYRFKFDFSYWSSKYICNRTRFKKTIRFISLFNLFYIRYNSNFLGIFLFEYFKIYFTKNVELVFNILLFIFLIYFIYTKVRSLYKRSEINFEISNLSLKNIIIKTLGFTYLNPHVYSDTVFFLGNFSKTS